MRIAWISIMFSLVRLGPSEPLEFDTDSDIEIDSCWGSGAAEGIRADVVGVETLVATLRAVVVFDELVETEEAADSTSLTELRARIQAKSGKRIILFLFQKLRNHSERRQPSHLN